MHHEPFRGEADVGILEVVLGQEEGKHGGKVFEESVWKGI